METEFFTLEKLPDLTLAQYSAEESGGVDDVIKQHLSFYRQLNRKGQLFGEVYHLIYLYVPTEPPGKRLKVYFKADGNESGKRPVCMKEFMDASSLSTYFHFQSVDREEKNIVNPVFHYRAFLSKKDGFVLSSQTENESGYYTVNPWKPNDKARLMGLFRLMQHLGRPVAYVVTINALDRSEQMRSAFRQQIQYIRNAQKQNHGVRDENAEQCIRNYDKLFESLRSNPHFRCRISAYAGHPDLAKMILDAAASEAVEEGIYNIVSEDGIFRPMMPERNVPEMCDPNTPRGMREWNSLFLLKELVPFAMFPVLYPGETIEIPKESAPVYKKSGLYLGVDNSGYSVYLPLDLLPKHALLAGVPGSGKTYSMLHISSQLAGVENDIPILVLEPAKKEYRALARNRNIPDLVVFSPGASGSFPLRINPFEFPIGFKLSEHITALKQIFEGAFDLMAPMPFLVSEAIDRVYRDHGWYPFEINNGSHTYPSVRELYNQIEKLMNEYKYPDDVRNNLVSCLQVRIGSLITREMGDIFDVPSSTFTPEEWLKIKCVIELEALGSYVSNFLTLLLLTIIREMLKQNPSTDEERPRHVIFLEEAHNLIGPTTVANAENGDTKVASTKYIVDMLAEVRALKEAIIIADQLPTGLAPQVVKNTSLKIGHKITAMDDRQLLASTMSADGVQLEKMAVFKKGHALCVYEDVQKPFEIQIAEYMGTSKTSKEASKSPDNEELFEFLRVRPIYQEIMKRDCMIMEKKFQTKKALIIEAIQLIEESEKSIEHDIAHLESRGEVPTDEEEKIIEKKRTKIKTRVNELAVNWLEFLLEYMNYYEMNQLQIYTVGQENIGKEVDEFSRVLQSYMGKDGFAGILSRAKLEMAQVCKLIRKAREMGYGT